MLLAFVCFNKFTLHIKSAFFNRYMMGKYMWAASGVWTSKRVQPCLRAQQTLVWSKSTGQELGMRDLARGRIVPLVHQGSKDKLLDDMIFGSKDTYPWEEFSHLMSNECEMSMMGELNSKSSKQTKRSSSAIPSMHWNSSKSLVLKM